MSALYQMQYHGTAGGGAGVIYIGKGLILGMDVTGSRYQGFYNDNEARLLGSATLTSTGNMLVTGQSAAAGSKISITFDLPPDLGGGQLVQVNVDGASAMVSFSKIGDIP